MRRILITSLFMTLVSTVCLSTLMEGKTTKVQGTLSPTEALHSIFQELAERPTEQGAIAQKYLDRVKTTGLSRDEQFALGEVYFVALKGKDAREIFETFSSGTDLQSRIARQRLMRMKFAIDEKVAEVEKEIYEYRAKFLPIKTDKVHLSGIVSGHARYYQERGEYEKAVKLIVDEVHSLPSDAAFRSFYLPATFFKSFVETGKTDLAIALLEKTRAALKARLGQDANPVQGPPPKVSAEHRAGVFHRLEEGLSADLPDYAQVLRADRRLLGYLESELAKIKKAAK